MRVSESKSKWVPRAFVWYPSTYCTCMHLLVERLGGGLPRSSVAMRAAAAEQRGRLAFVRGPAREAVGAEDGQQVLDVTL